jgi:hypothetical protein
MFVHVVCCAARDKIEDTLPVRTSRRGRSEHCTLLSPTSQDTFRVFVYVSTTLMSLLHVLGLSYKFARIICIMPAVKFYKCATPLRVTVF